MGLHSTSIFSLDANVAGECGKLGLSMYFLNFITPPLRALTERVMERPSKRAGKRAPRSPSMFYSIPLRECVPLVFEPLSPSSSPFAFERKRLRRTRRRRLEAPFRSASPRALPLSLPSLASSPARLLASISHSVIGGFPGRTALRSGDFFGKRQPAELVSSAHFSGISKTGFLQ